MTDSSKISQPVKAPLKDLALIFLRLGTIAFGGPAAHIAMIDQEIVERRQMFFLEYFSPIFSHQHNMNSKIKRSPAGLRVIGFHSYWQIVR
nr:chromate transporter [Spirulina subsalsa]